MKTALAAALLLGLAPAVVRAQATAPDFRTGFCVAPDTGGALHPALAAMVSEPAQPPRWLPEGPVPAFPDEGCRVVGRLRFAPARHEGRPVFAQAMQPFTYSATVRR